MFPIFSDLKGFEKETLYILVMALIFTMGFQQAIKIFIVG